MTSAISARVIRQLLESSLPSDADLNAFCLDFFPNVYKRFTQSLDRVQKTNILLEQVTNWTQILSALKSVNVDLQIGDGDPSRSALKIPDNGKRILVVGTGENQLSEEHIAAEAVGAGLARAGFRLICGGWPGVDQVATESFRSEVNAAGMNPFERIIQVLLHGRVPVHSSGRVERVASADAEFSRSIELADALVLIGGRGATYEMYQAARRAMKPAFALADSGGDAKRAYFDMLDYWPAETFGIVNVSAYSTLSEPIGSDARTLVEKLIGLLQMELRLVSVSETAAQ